MNLIDISITFVQKTANFSNFNSQCQFLQYFFMILVQILSQYFSIHPSFTTGFVIVMFVEV